MFNSPVSHLNLRFSVAICCNCCTDRGGKLSKRCCVFFCDVAPVATCGADDGGQEYKQTFTQDTVFLEMGNFPNFGDFEGPFGDFEGPLGNFICWGFPIQMLGNFVCSSLLSKFTVSDIF